MKITEMENALHFSSIQKSEQQSLDELESEITEEFIIEPLYDEKDENVEKEEEKPVEMIEWFEINYEKMQDIKIKWSVI